MSHIATPSQKPRQADSSRREVGISDESIALAALAVPSTPPVARRMLGLPVGVERTVELRRTFSDAEWERFVVQLRETFGARGSVQSEGSLRQWTNGNLQVMHELPSRWV